MSGILLHKHWCIHWCYFFLLILAVLTNLEKINSLPTEIQSNTFSKPAGKPTTLKTELFEPSPKISYQSEYEVIDTSTQPIKKPPTANIACFPPRQSSSLFNSINSTNTLKIDNINRYESSSLLNKVIKDEIPTVSNKM